MASECNAQISWASGLKSVLGIRRVDFMGECLKSMRMFETYLQYNCFPKKFPKTPFAKDQKGSARMTRYS